MFARRIVAELRSAPGPDQPAASDDLLELWTRTIEQWNEQARWCRRQDRPFRWVSELDPEMAEFLLAGLDRSLHSERVRDLCTDEEIARQRPFTVLVIRSFVDGLTSESEGCRQYADQVSTSLRRLLPD